MRSNEVIVDIDDIEIVGTARKRGVRWYGFIDSWSRVNTVNAHRPLR